jgi:phage terminase large subunit-like protein
MRGNNERIARGTESLLAMVQDGRIWHNGDRVLRVHVLNAKRRRNQYGLTFGKEHAESSRKIDSLAALTLAWIAHTDLAESGKKAKPEYSRRLIQF